MENNNHQTKIRWLILALAALTNTIVVAAPGMSMSVLFKEISSDLNLDLVQVGLVWGISSLPGIVTVLAGGAIADRFGPKRVLILACLVSGLTMAFRGLASDFGTLLAAMFVSGFLSPVITMNTFKACGMWFSGRQIGLASGVLSMGMALGFMLGSLFSATLLSPWLGGWRNVMFFYGALGVLLAIPWIFTRARPASAGIPASLIDTGSMRRNLAHVARIRNVWLYGLTILGIGGCIQGTLGYIPLYLLGQGWPQASADGALATFHTVSLICVIPIALWSDKIGSRKKILVAAALMIISGVSLLSVARGPLVWVAVCMAGMVRDGFMAVFMTSILESPGVGPEYAGTAIGMVMVFSGIGSLLAPPIGNSLGDISPGLPFLFWAALMLLGFTGLFLAKERLKQTVLTPG
jgi:MFS family permease